MMKNKYSKAMSIIEYSLLVAIVAAAILGIQIYLKRAVCDHWRQSADVFGHGRQYDAPELQIWED